MQEPDNSGFLSSSARSFSDHLYPPELSHQASATCKSLITRPSVLSSCATGSVRQGLSDHLYPPELSHQASAICRSLITRPSVLSSFKPACRSVDAVMPTRRMLLGTACTSRSSPCLSCMGKLHTLDQQGICSTSTMTL